MSKRHKKRYDKSVYRSLILITQFGINMLVPICIMSVIGIFLDQRLGTSFWMILLFCVGAIAGGQNVFRMARSIYDRPGDNSQKNSMATGAQKGEQEDNRSSKTEK